MGFDRIDRLVSKEGMSFQAWDDRYSRGVWAALGFFEGQVDIARDLSSDSDMEAFDAAEYLFSADWLPYVTGRTLAEAMQNLEDRLALLPQDQLNRKSQWARLVSDAIDALAEKSKRQLPATFELAVAKSTTAME